MEHVGMNYALTLPVAGVICFAFGFLFGQPALRLSGVYLALATFALATAMPQLLKLGYFEQWTGGVQGLVVTKPDAPFGCRCRRTCGFIISRSPSRSRSLSSRSISCTLAPPPPPSRSPTIRPQPLLSHSP